jgi:hypothetical protein
VSGSIANCKLQIADCRLVAYPRPLVAATIMAVSLFSSACGQRSDDGKAASSERNPARSVVERGPVRVTAEVQPAKARLSDEPVLTLTIDYQSGVEIEKPPFGAAMGDFVVRDFREPQPRIRNGREIVQQIYTLEPVRTGRLLIDPITVTFTDLRPDGDERTHTIATEALTVEISSMLADSAPSLERLRPPAEPVDLPSRISWAGWSIAGTCLVIAVLGLWLWIRLRRRKLAAEVALSPQEVALLELEKLAKSRLAERDVKLFFVEITGIVRRYIERTTGIRAPEQTTEEFLRETSLANAFNRETSERLRDFLESADLVKFAAYQPRQEDIGESFSRARVFIGWKSPDAAEQPQEAAA